MRIVDWAARSLTTTLVAVVGLAALAIFAGIRLDLTPVGAFGLYFVIWWTTLFAILPVRMQARPMRARSRRDGARRSGSARASGTRDLDHHRVGDRLHRGRGAVPLAGL
jgi:hypothetical protein